MIVEDFCETLPQPDCRVCQRCTREFLNKKILAHLGAVYSKFYTLFWPKTLYLHCILQGFYHFSFFGWLSKRTCKYFCAPAPQCFAFVHSAVVGRFKFQHQYEFKYEWRQYCVFWRGKITIQSMYIRHLRFIFYSSMFWLWFHLNSTLIDQYEIKLVLFHSSKLVLELVLVLKSKPPLCWVHC